MPSLSVESLPLKERKEIKARLWEIRKALRDRRIELQLTQDRLAELAGTTPEIIRKIENGTKYPSLIMLLRIERALGLKGF